MSLAKKKTTAPYPSVGADEEQSLDKITNLSIAIESAENKSSEPSFNEMFRKMQRIYAPAYLPTVSMQDLYETVYPSRPPIIDGLLYAGTYLFVGAPKVGKSFLMAQIGYHVSTGLELWGLPGSSRSRAVSGVRGRSPAIARQAVPYVWHRKRG